MLPIKRSWYLFIFGSIKSLKQPSENGWKRLSVESIDARGQHKYNYVVIFINLPDNNTTKWLAVFF